MVTIIAMGERSRVLNVTWQPKGLSLRNSFFLSSTPTYKETPTWRSNCGKHVSKYGRSWRLVRLCTYQPRRCFSAAGKFRGSDVVTHVDKGVRLFLVSPCPPLFPAHRKRNSVGSFKRTCVYNGTIKCSVRKRCAHTTKTSTQATNKNSPEHRILCGRYPACISCYLAFIRYRCDQRLPC